jgi:hypothetical protein
VLKHPERVKRGGRPPQHEPAPKEGKGDAGAGSSGAGTSGAAAGGSSNPKKKGKGKK